MDMGLLLCKMLLCVSPFESMSISQCRTKATIVILQLQVAIFYWISFVCVCVHVCSAVQNDLCFARNMKL